jgi:hypothetical protein
VLPTSQNQAAIEAARQWGAALGAAVSRIYTPAGT